MSYQPQPPNSGPPGQPYSQSGPGNQPPAYTAQPYGQYNLPAQPYGQPAVYPQPLPPTYSQPITYSYPPAPFPTRAKTNPLYAVAGLGGFLLAVSTFLAWATVRLANIEISVNGLGAVSSNSGVGTSGANLRDGFIALGIGIVAMVLAGLGGFSGRRGYAIGLVVLGLLGSGLMLFELSDISRKLGNVSGVSVGFGLWLGFFGGLLILAGGILALVGRRS